VGAYQVMAGYVTVETAVDGGSRARVDIPRGAVLPDDVPAAEVTALLNRDDIIQVDDDPDGPGVDLDGDGVPEGSAKQVLDWVAGDKDKATQALAAEQAKGDSARKGLLADLSKLVEA
jgi:hypothetical protein